MKRQLHAGGTSVREANIILLVCINGFSRQHAADCCFRISNEAHLLQVIILQAPC